MLTRVVVCCAIMAATCHATKLPSYIKPCARNRPDFKECALKSAKEAIPRVVKGDRKLNIPSSNPLLLEEMIVGTSPGPIDITIITKNVKIWGLPESSLTAYDVDFDKHVNPFTLFVPKLEVECDYNMTGKILILPVSGNGRGNITLINLSIAVIINFSLKKENGKEYMHIDETNVKMDTKRMYMTFENVFNGDKFLGEQLSQVLDANWKDVFDAISPSMEANMAEIMDSVTGYSIEHIPYDELFPVDATV